jgi:hypothetical protein
VISPYLEKPVRSLEQALGDIERKCAGAEDGVSNDRRMDRDFRGSRPDPNEDADRQSRRPGDALVPPLVAAVAAAAPAMGPP